MTNPESVARAALKDDPRASELLGVVRETLSDLRRHPMPATRITLNSSLDRDLGLDSLARVELLLRVERAFGVQLPENTLQVAETPRDLLAALQSAVVAHDLPSPGARRAIPQPVEFMEAEPVTATTLIEVLDWHVQAHAQRKHIVFLSDAGEEEISYGRLRAGAISVAAGLQRQGIRPGRTVAIMLPTSPEYFYTYFGIILAGAIPVPIYPPARLSQIEEHVRRHAGILANAQASMLVTGPEAMAVGRLLVANVPGLRQVVTAASLSTADGDFIPAPVAAGNIAFIQYTSGSTGNPKGVALTHANLLANIRAMAQAAKASERDVFVSWLPLYHDMGLIGAWLGSLYVGFQLVIMSPLAFLARPERWLWAIHRFRGTLTAGPNFGYELCLKRIVPEQLAGLDLSSLRMAFNGAEPVSPDTVTRFAERFAPHGFRSAAIAPVYGLAESCVGLLFPPPGRGALIDCIRRDSFTRHGAADPAPPGDSKALRFVNCGRPLPGHEVRIVDETGREVGERVEGRLEFRGPSATHGYHRNAEATRQLFHGDWLDTGDRAYMAEGDVYVTGRVKDIIIRGGRNIHPEEVEEAVGALPGLRKGCVAVFGSPDPESGTERLIVLAETREAAATTLEILRQSISRVTTDILGEPPDDVVLAPPHTVLKTSSGKIRRSASRELYETGLVGARSHAVWRQVARLVWNALSAQLRRWRVVASEVLYAAYASAVFWLVAPVTWLITAMIPRPVWAWNVGHVAARLFLQLTRTPLLVRGVENLPPGKPSVIVANHASYLDGLIFVAAIPIPYRFVAKRELRASFVSRIYLERLGVEFVERLDAARSVEDANRLAGEAAHGTCLAFFPEGTFTRAPGLLPFHLGAFVAAAQAHVPVVPVSIRGSRAMLRADQWFPRRGSLVVTIGAPILATGETTDAFASALSLREAARTEILAHCGEPDAA